MGSLFGRGNFGVGLYGWAYTTFEGRIIAEAALSGDFRNPVKRFSASLDAVTEIAAPDHFEADRYMSGAIAFDTVMYGNLTKGQPVDFSGGLTFGVVVNTLAGGLIYRGLSGTLSVDFELSAEPLRNMTKYFAGSLGAAAELSARALGNGVRRFEGNLIVTERMTGHVNRTIPMSGRLIASVNIEGTEYIGYFWKPAPPVNGGWEPIPEPDSIWVNVG